MIMSLPILLALAAPSSPCITVDQDRVYARDLAGSIPQFASMPPDFPLGYSPAPGARRVLTGVSLKALAKGQGVQLEGVSDVCVEFRMAKLSEEEIHSALVEGYGGDQVRIAVSAWGPDIAPLGQVVFPRGGLQLPADRDPNHDALWRGYVLYGANRRFSVWARARIAVATTQVVAVTDIPAGAVIREENVRIAATETAAPDDRLARSLDQVLGLAPRTAIRAGSPLVRSQLDRVPEVVRGDTVTVQASEGGAVLVFSAKAQSSGAIGSTVWMRNPASGKGFRAKVTGKDAVAVRTVNGAPLQ